MFRVVVCSISFIANFLKSVIVVLFFAFHVMLVICFVTLFSSLFNTVCVFTVSSVTRCHSFSQSQRLLWKDKEGERGSWSLWM